MNGHTLSTKMTLHEIKITRQDHTKQVHCLAKNQMIQHDMI